MLRRKALEKMLSWKEGKTKQALLVVGARQVGKTYLIREFAQAHYENVIEINLLENKEAKLAFDKAQSREDYLLVLSAFGGSRLVKARTLVFVDEIQESKEIVTAIKFLVDSGEYDYVLSGSLLGVELKNIRSVPVGYLHTIEMFPLDFEEFCWASGVGDDVFEEMKRCFRNKEPLREFLHTRLLKLFHEYLIIGGMPDPANEYIKNRDIRRVRVLQRDIIAFYKEDATKYAAEDARAIKRIYDLIPSELDKQNKRFIIKSAFKDAHFDRHENKFLWLVDAAIAIAVYNVSEPRHPLMLSMQSKLFKLFLNDIGLLACQCGMDTTREALAGNGNVNYGSFYENAVAQELKAQGIVPYYFKNKKIGELDFVIEAGQGQIIPVEVKSGKDYKRHSALTNTVKSSNYAISEAYVFCESNVSSHRNICYFPIYMIGSISGK